MIRHHPWGNIAGQQVTLWRLTAQTAIGPVEIAVSDYGATLQTLIVPDAAGVPTDIVLGHDTLEQYVAGNTYFGAIAGRYGNRIRDGRLVIDGAPHQLDRNEGAHHLHGGSVGFDRRIWQAQADGDSLIFRLTSADGDMGYPGQMEISVCYRIMPEGGLDVDMTATADRTTICNPVQHSYFNLAGTGDIQDHIARFNASFYTPVDPHLLATGEILSVTDTPFDFRQPKPFCRDLMAASPHPELAPDSGLGYDHNLILGAAGPDGLRDCATVLSPRNGLGLTLQTTEPGLQLYTGGDLSPEVIGKSRLPSVQFGGFTLETQKFPCSPEFGHFEQALLRPGDLYHHRMVFRFFHKSSGMGA